MTPKEKAQDLVNQMLGGDDFGETYLEEAINNAIIAAREAHQAELNIIMKFESFPSDYQGLYWLEVIQELGKLQ